MSRRKNEIKRKAFPFIIIGSIIAVFLIIGAFFYIKPQNTGQTIISQDEGISDSQIVSNDYKLGNLTISLPSGWTEIKEKDEAAEDGIGFIHNASNSGFYIDQYSYEPEVNLLLFQTDAASFLPQGSILTDYNTNGRDESTLYYEAQSNAGTYYCAKKYLWDKDQIYVLTININSAYYDRLADTMDYIINSAEYNGINKIDEDIYLDYDSNFVCQYGMPYGWLEENGVFYKDDNNLSISLINKPSDFDISKYNLMDFQNDFPTTDVMYTTLRPVNDYYIAEGIINTGGGKSVVYLKHLTVNGNKYLIGFVWRYTDDSVRELADKCIKEFSVKEATSDTENTTSTNPSTASVESLIENNENVITSTEPSRTQETTAISEESVNAQ